MVLYIMQFAGGKGGAFKIGITKDIDRRYKELCRKYKNKLEIVMEVENCNFQDETYFKRILKEYNYYGEWYDISILKGVMGLMIEKYYPADELQKIMNKLNV